MKEILETKDYGKFVLSEFNRDVKKTWNLEASMQEHGWIDAYPLHVIKRADGLLEIKAGHHRFYVAKKLDIPVKYVECQDKASILGLEDSTVPWTLWDYLLSYVKMGKVPYMEVLEYHEKTGINLSACISMLAGDSADSGNWSRVFKLGKYRLGDDIHARIVGDIVLHCKRCGFAYSTAPNFVKAVSKVAWAEGFDFRLMKRKLKAHSELMKKQASKNDYIIMLEYIFNRQSKDKVPLAFNAEKAAKKRSATYPRPKMRGKLAKEGKSARQKSKSNTPKLSSLSKG